MGANNPEIPDQQEPITVKTHSTTDISKSGESNFVFIEESSQDDDLLLAAEINDWDEVLSLIDIEATSHEYFTGRVDTRKRTILHYACEIANKHEAQETVEAILSRARSFGISSEDLSRFINRQDCDGKTALHVSAGADGDRPNKALVELLVYTGADVNLSMTKGRTEAISLIYQNVPKAILALFNHHIQIKEDEFDPDEDFWEVGCDFSPVTGLRGPSEDKVSDGKILCQTSLLSRALREKQMKRSEVLLHPLVQIFLHLKSKKFKRLIWLSIAYHILWSILCTIHIVTCSTTTTPASSLTPVNSSGGDPLNNNSGTVMNLQAVNDEPPSSYNYYYYIIIWKTVFWIFFALTFAKEVLEVKCCPGTIQYYLRQMENLGQWTLLLCVFLLWVFSYFGAPDSASTNDYLLYAEKIIIVVAIFTAWLLVLGQFNKLESIGIFMEMLATVSKEICKFLLAFSPLFIAFILTFGVLMPEKEQFSITIPPWGITKLFAMMTGEIEYDDTFHPEDKGDSVKWAFLTKLLYLVYIVMVTIVLQNLLIGLTISDIQALQRQAQEKHLATLLEQIYLIENTLMLEWVQSLMKRLKMTWWLEKLLVTTRDTQKPASLKDTSVESAWTNKQVKDYPKHLQSEIVTAVKEKKLELKTMPEGEQ